MQSVLSGNLVELTSEPKLRELQLHLMNKHSNQSFWVGASDLDEEGTFRWFYSGDQVKDDLWSAKPKKENRCLRFNKHFVKFSARACNSTARFICEVGRRHPSNLRGSQSDANPLAVLSGDLPAPGG